MTFSKRMGIKPIEQQLQVTTIDTRLKNALWNALYMSIPNEGDNNDRIEIFRVFCYSFYVSFLGGKVNDFESSYYTRFYQKNILVRLLEKWYVSLDRRWYEIYDFIEFALPFFTDDFKNNVNVYLERERAGYRVVDDKIIRITSEEEVRSVEESLNVTNEKYHGVNTHLKAALTLLSDRENPDYRNSIKESISAVESLCKKLVNDDKARLSNALKLLKDQHDSHPALLDAFSKLYGYTSDGDGIRHAIMDDGNKLDFHDAKYMLITCSAFINLMIGKLER